MSHFNSLTVCGVLLVTTMVPAVADAQPTGHALEVFGTLGVGRVYLDTSALDHTVAGGGARFRLSRRFAVQGDWLAIRWNDSFQRLEARLGAERVSVGSLTFIGVDPSTNPVRAYWLAGLSVPLGGRAPAIVPTIGLGARIFLSDRYFLAPEVRGGLAPLFRLSVSAGIALGAR